MDKAGCPLLIAAILCIAACETAPGTALILPDSASRQNAAGDWNDIDAAVEIGAGQAEWVIADWWYENEDTRNYRLRNALGTEAQLRIQRPPGEPGGNLSITVSVGPLGDAAAERELIERISRRLNHLHGVDAAEIK